MAQPELAVAPVEGTTVQQRADVGAMTAATLALAGQEDPEATLVEIGQWARRVLPTSDEIGVTLIRSRGRIETPIATGLAAACVPLLLDPDVGPCRSLRDVVEPVHIANTTDEQRWPQFAARAASLSVGSVLAVPMSATRGTVGLLSFVAAATSAFDEQAALIGAAYATHAGIALTHIELETNLRVGLQTREEIGRAVGILMERHRITAAAAFDMLVVASQHSHRKLRDVAAWMNETGEDPAALTRTRA
ncbi:MAG TPA: GAF and ANTAR domain-containing protein [Jatrophihabitans sp.]|nr:GAF and ANTAR domain-containing protein [Jatrophihabitans sp.]